MEWSGRTHRRLDDEAEDAPHRIDLGQGKLSMTAGSTAASTSSVAWPGRSMTAT